MMNRRELIKAASASLLLAGLSSPARQSLAQAKSSGKRLVLIELSGANDGLNTLVPYKNEEYYKLRPVLGLSQKNIISLDDEFALHNALLPLMSLWERNELAWVHGLGYPSANRSHFKSIALWETGGDGLIDGRDGWMTHDIQHRLGRSVSDAHGISLEGDLNLFGSDSGRWMSIESARQIMNTQAPLPDSDQQYNAAVDLVSSRMHELHHSLNSIRAKLKSNRTKGKVQAQALGQQLTEVLKLIGAGVDTPIYRVQLHGFDTHVNQLGRHKRLLQQLANGVSQFRQQLIMMGEWDNTLIMSYSEFGRRAAENGSAGTDHGTAAPHFLTGGGVSGGLFGKNTDLFNLVDGDPLYTMDYRALYDRVLSDWFGIDDNRFSDYHSSLLDGLIV